MAGEAEAQPEGERREQVNHPRHYFPGIYEAINVILAWGLNFNLGNAVKYISRAGRKSVKTRLEDLRKAKWYLEAEIERAERLEGKSTEEPKLHDALFQHLEERRA
jgi:hypothetical protein